MKTIDETNRKILNILQDRGSITNAELAGIIGLAPATVFERVKKLEKSGIIKKTVAVVDPHAVGKSIIAFVFFGLAIRFVLVKWATLPEDSQFEISSTRLSTILYLYLFPL